MAFPILTGSEFGLNATVDGIQTYAVVKGFADGRFVAVWEDRQANGQELRGQFFDKSGGWIGGEFAVNTTLSGQQLSPTSRY